MILKMALSMGVAMFLAAGAQAQAAPNAHETPESPRGDDATQVAEIEALKAQLQPLGERLPATEQKQREMDEVAAAQAAPAQAANGVQTIPGGVHAEVAQTGPPPNPGWANDTQISGRMYFDLTDLEQKRDGARIAPTGAGSDIKRFYLGVDHRFDDIWSANLTTDAAYVSADGLTQVYVKKAYLQAKLSDAGVIRVGSADMPWIPFVDEIYGYRFVENTLIDRTKSGTSADWGVHAGGRLAGGLVSYAVSVVDGAGYKNPVRTKGVDLEGRVNLNYNGLVLALGGYRGRLGKDVGGGSTSFHDASRWDALAAYVQPRFRVGVEYYAASNWKNVTTIASDKSDGYSVFSSFKVTPEISAFGRWDKVRPSKTLKDSETDTYFNIGVNWEPVKVVDLALVYKRDKVDHGLFATSNGVIGGVNTGAYDEIGLWGQFRW